VVEAMREIEAHDLVTLCRGRAVGDQSELHAGLAQGVDGGVGVRIELVLVSPHLGEGVGDAVGQRLVLIAELGQRPPCRQPPRPGIFSRHLAATVWSVHSVRASSMTATRTRSIPASSCTSRWAEKM